MPCDDPQARRASAYADRKLGRADAAACLLVEVPFDDAVFRRMKADDGDAPARPQQLHRPPPRCLPIAELFVHCDAQCLKAAPPGMDTSRAPWTKRSDYP